MTITIDSFEAVIDRVEELDLNGVKQRIEETATGSCWSRNIVNEVELEYRRFLTLNALYPDRRIAPAPLVDIFWHEHILDTVQYDADCESAIGYFLHHHPCSGGSDSDDDQLTSAREETLDLYTKHFPNGNIMYWLPNQVFDASTPRTTVPVPSECYSTPEPHGG